MGFFENRNARPVWPFHNMAHLNFAAPGKFSSLVGVELDERPPPQHDIACAMLRSHIRTFAEPRGRGMD